MKTDHLTEEILQSYLENKSIPEKKQLESHINSCAYCKEQIQSYQLVHSGLSEKCDEDFSEEFEKLLITKIESVLIKKRQKKYVSGLSFIIALGIGLLVYIFSLLDFFKITIDSSRISFNELADLIRHSIMNENSLNKSTDIILLTVIILLVFGLPNWKKIIFRVKM